MNEKTIEKCTKPFEHLSKRLKVTKDDHCVESYCLPNPISETWVQTRFGLAPGVQSLIRTVSTNNSNSSASIRSTARNRTFLRCAVFSRYMCVFLCIRVYVSELNRLVFETGDSHKQCLTVEC